MTVESALKIQKLEFVKNAPMSKFTTFRVGGPAEFLVFVRNLNDLTKVLEVANDFLMNPFVLGAGSNIVVSDEGIKGITLKLTGEFNRVEFNGSEIRAGAGAKLPKIARITADKGLSGLEFAVSIPSSVGGAVMMNAGAYGSSTAEVLKRIVIVKNGKIEELPADSISFGYRFSSLQNDDCIVAEAVFKLKEDNTDKIKMTMKKYVEIRNKSQPKGASAGSVFKNPEGMKAWKLIRECGLAGYRIGGAVVSEKHANFIINDGNATATDVKRLVELVKSEVFSRFGIMLEEEIKFVGF